MARKNIVNVVCVIFRLPTPPYSAISCPACYGRLQGKGRQTGCLCISHVSKEQKIRKLLAADLLNPFIVGKVTTSQQKQTNAVRIVPSTLKNMLSNAFPREYTARFIDPTGNVVAHQPREKLALNEESEPGSPTVKGLCTDCDDPLHLCMTCINAVRQH